MFWFQQGLCFLPAFLVISSSCTFIVPYLIAIFRRDVDVVFPYISDAGARPPESCVFGLLTFVSACAATVTIYSRYKFVEQLKQLTRLSPRLNECGLWFGMLSCLGMCMVATFQETAVTIVHDIGALIFFVSGVIYTILQTVISYQAYPYGSSLSVCRARLAVCIIAALAFIPTVACAQFVKQTVLHRHTRDKDYVLHLISAVFEWINAFSFVCFFLTYIDDFKVFTLQVNVEFAEQS
ncbi:DNA damage-regulated autophagy modulator protein 1 [Betta splendens]|uniref:DNA damage-regulated autophagy modulator protein 1 n=1 Tax=Betta splendens TaxID=158456 RepID=A0A6P7NG72_BETSP|nr:DNA damage-regulated autophagy modulator protein 1 [Betta splendens]XP_055367208.1 DNA damage-regulated autophagy modulator protein 1 [Betta splendens]